MPLNSVSDLFNLSQQLFRVLSSSVLSSCCALKFYFLLRFIFPLLSVSGNEEVDSEPLLSAPSNIAVKETKAFGDTEVNIVLLLFFVSLSTNTNFT